MRKRLRSRDRAGAPRHRRLVAFLAAAGPVIDGFQHLRVIGSHAGEDQHPASVMTKASPGGEEQVHQRGDDQAEQAHHQEGPIADRSRLVV